LFTIHVNENKTAMSKIKDVSMSPELFVYLDIEEVKRYLVREVDIPSHGTVVWHRQSGDTPMDMSATKKKKGKKYQLCSLKDHVYCEVTLGGAVEFAVYAEVMIPQNFQNSREIFPIQLREYEVDLPSYMETFYSVGDHMRELKGPTFMDMVWKMFGVRQNTQYKKHRGRLEQRLELSSEQLERIVANELVGTTEAAEILDLSVRRVHKLAKDGRIGMNVEGRYVFTRTELDQFKDIERPPGAPRTES